MIHDKTMKAIDVVNEYPFNSTFIPVDNLSLECINNTLEEHDTGFKIKTLDADYIHIYNNCAVLVVNFNGDIRIYTFCKKDEDF